MHIPILTTVQRDALTPTAGMLVYNSTTTQFNKYENGAWRADLGFNSDHGGLGGLGDDDHTIYQKEDLLTTQGDLPYATAASTWARLPKGTGLQLLRMNAGATAPEWASVAITTSNGNYAGDSAANKAIAHSLGVTPRIIFIFADLGIYFYRIIVNLAFVQYMEPGASGQHAVTGMDSTNFYVGNAANYAQSANNTGVNYYWVAIG